MIPLLASLAVAAQVVVACIVGAWVVQRTTARRPFDALVRLVGRDSLRLAALVALVATAGSLYFSEVRHFPPCVLCWYQRIAMYPQVLLLGIAAATSDWGIRRYVAPLSLAGAAVSAYHVQLELFPDQESISCSATVPCTTVWFREFGYVTLPVLAMSAFLLVAVLAWIGGRYGQGIAREA